MVSLPLLAQLAWRTNYRVFLLVIGRKVMEGFNGIASPPWSIRTRRTISLIILAVVAVFAWRMNDIWPPLVVSLVLAYLLTPIVSAFQQRVPFGSENMRRTIGTVLTFVLMLLVIVFVVLLIVPAIIGQLRQFGDGIPALIAQIQEGVEHILSVPITVGSQTIVPLEIIQEQVGFQNGESFLPEGIDVLSTLQSLLAPLATPVLGALGTALSLILVLIFVLTMIFYLMKDGPLFVRQVENLAPAPYREDVHQIFLRLGGVWNAYLRGQIVLCLAMGLAGFLAATILGLPSPMVLGLINGVLEFIPNLGPALALLPAGVFALVFPSTTIPGLQGVVFLLVVIIVWTGLQNLEAVLLVPRVMGDNLDLHPFVVIVAVIGGASLAGALGVILAAPVVASLRVLGEYVYAKLLDQPLPNWPYRASIVHRLPVEDSSPARGRSSGTLDAEEVS